MRNISLKFLSSVAIIVMVSLACTVTDAGERLIAKMTATQPSKPVASATQPSKPVASVSQAPEAAKPASQQGAQAGFNEADCNFSGIIFDNISFDNLADDIYDGPYLSCSYSTTGAHGLSETVYFRIVAYKADKLEEFYQDLKDNITGHVVQANEWNAHPDLSPELKNEITVIRDDADGYIFMITKYANVQGCTKGDGYGVEKVNGKYLVQLVFTSCESDATAYLASMQYLQSVAEEAIKRVEASAQP